MDIGGGGSRDVNSLQTDAATMRNEDYLVDNALAFAWACKMSGVSAKYSTIQILNPTASDLKVFIDQVHIWCPTSTAIRIGHYNTELANDVGGFRNKRLGSATGETNVFYEALGTVAPYGNIETGLLANTPLVVRFKYGFELDPGAGLAVACHTVNLALSVGYEMKEV